MTQSEKFEEKLMEFIEDLKKDEDLEVVEFGHYLESRLALYGIKLRKKDDPSSAS